MVIETLSHKLNIENDEDQPNPQCVGSEFVKQYYTTLSKAPYLLFRFYTENSSFVHGGLDKDDDETVIGQKAIYKKIQSLNFSDCRTKIRKVDSHPTVSDGIVIQVSGEISNNGGPMRRFNQTFVLGHQRPRRYYVINDIFRYQDEIFEDSEDTNLVDHINRHNIHGLEPHSLGHMELHLNSVTQPQNLFDHSLMYSQQSTYQNQHSLINHASPTSTSLHSSNHIMNGVYEHDLNQDNTFGSNFSLSKNHVIDLQSQNKIAIDKIHSSNEPFQEYNDGALSINENGIDSWNSDEDSLVAKMRLGNEEKHFVESKKNIVDDSANLDSMSDRKERENKINELSSGPKTYAQLLTIKSQVSTTQHSLPPQLHNLHTISTNVNEGSINHKIVNNIGSSEEKISDTAMKNLNFKGASYFNTKHFDQTEIESSTALKVEGSGNVRGRYNANNRLNQQDNTNDTPNGFSKIRQPTNPSVTPAFSSTHPDSHQIFVGNLPHTISENELRKFFSEYGLVVDVKINSGQKDGGRRVPNYGFVIFSTPDPVKLLISEKPIMYKGHRLNVEEKKNPKKIGVGNFSSPRASVLNNGFSQNFAGANRNVSIRPGFHSGGGNSPRMHAPSFRNNMHPPTLSTKK